ncbi:FAD-dependent monooxygenase [Dactylosporangium roseum]|uniref:FAD-dependent monooxygenase n=1 Tax=Dactylosporangium roseum TaxID=47989 RepID=A0ABY5YZ43_9ACTN|nr:FAD-dependent monooxygenase [Dactylosporangium roseum]UWZ34654.1 FAD-dependent monooxygenase [Dactylosporangium roseum]
MTETDVLVVGAGPTGLTLACDLLRHGVRARVIDKSAMFFQGSRGKGVTPRTVEVFDDLGISEQAKAASTTLMFRHYDRCGGFRDQPLPGYWTPTPNSPYTQLLIPQGRTEQLLRDRLAALGGSVELDTELIELAQSAQSVQATLRNGRQTAHVDVRYLVGCDGGHSAVRRMLGAVFEGSTHESQKILIGDVEVAGLRRDRLHVWFDATRGFLQLCPFSGTAAWQFAAGLPEWGAHPPAPSLETFQQVVDHIAGHDRIRLASTTWLSTYRVNARMVDQMRWRRVFLAGDAAHVHPPTGGLGMNTGIQDAYNLGWKLALVLTGGAGPRLLDSYEQERLPIAAWALGTSSDRLRAMTEEIANGSAGNLANVGTADTRQLGLGYRWSTLSLDRGQPGIGLSAGDRAPDAPCQNLATGAPTRLFDLFRGTRFTLLGFGDRCAAALNTVNAAGLDRIHTALITDGRATPHAVTVTLLDEKRHAFSGYGISHDSLILVRPDGYIAATTGWADARTILDYLNQLGRTKAFRRSRKTDPLAISEP